VNYGCGVSRGALRELSRRAALSLAALDASQLDDAESFALLFTSSPAVAEVQYDATLAIELPPADAPPPPGAGAIPLRASAPLAPAAGAVADAEAVLVEGLAGRVTLVRAWHGPLPCWGLDEPAPRPPRAMRVGLWLDPGKASALVDRGPSPDAAAAVQAWVALWGEKSETRRFKDGAIVHAVVWDAPPAERHGVATQAVRALLHRHLGVPPASMVSSLSGLDATLATPAVAAGAGQPAAAGGGISHTSATAVLHGFEKLAGSIRNLRGLPLAVLGAHFESGPVIHLRGRLPLAPLAGHSD